MKNFVYPAKIEEDEGGFFLVTFRDIDFAMTDGETVDEALENAADCLNEALAGMIHHNEKLPLPSRARKGECLIVPDAVIAAKAALYVRVSELHLSKSGLALKLGKSEAVGRRLLDPKHNTKMVLIDEALRALNSRMVIGIQ